MVVVRAEDVATRATLRRRAHLTCCRLGALGRALLVLHSIHHLLISFTMSAPRIFYCPHCGHAPFASNKNLNIHLANSKLCAKRESNRPKPVPRKFNLHLEDPKDDRNGDNPEENVGEEPVNVALDDLFEEFYNTITAPDDNEPLFETPVNPPSTNNVSVDSQDADEDPVNQFWMNPDAKPWIYDFPKPAGTTKGQGVTEFEEIQKSEAEKGWGEWGPFDSEEDWELAQWLFKSVNQTKTNEFLKLKHVSFNNH